MEIINFNQKESADISTNKKKSKFLYFKAYHNGGRVIIQENTKFSFSEYMTCKKDEFSKNQLAKYKIFYLDSIRHEYLNDINGIIFDYKREISYQEYRLYTNLMYLVRNAFDDKNATDRMEAELHSINKYMKETYGID